MSFLFFSKKSHAHPRLIIDIGSGSVGGAIVSFKNDRPHIEHQTRVLLPIRSKIDATSLSADTKEALGKVVESVRKNSKVKMGEADVVCSSPWFSARTRLIHHEKPQPFVVTEKLIREISVDESKAMRTEMDKNVISIEERIARIRLNGYESHNPIGKKVARLDLLLFASFIPRDFAEQITHDIQATLAIKKITFHSLPFVSFHTFSRVWHAERQFGFLSVGAELSEFLLVDDGAIVETLSFPVGTNHLVRAIAHGQDISKELAATSLANFSKGSAEQSFNKKIETHILPIREEWLAYVDQVIHETLPDHHSVQKIYLSADGETTHFWSDAISSRVQTVLPLTSETFASFVEHASVEKLDLPIAIAALYIASLVELG